MTNANATTTTTRKRRVKYSFVLKDVDIEHVCKNYGLEFDLQLCQINKAQIPKCVTKLDELIKDDAMEFSYMDETRTKRKCVVSMVDMINGNSINGNSINGNSINQCNCFWCRNPFETTPIGCPVKYIPNVVIKKYYSHITKDYYTIREDVTVDKFEELMAETHKNTDESIQFQFIKNDYYEVDGVFCSFNCCLAYILDNRHNPLYMYSSQLLHDIYTRYYETNTSYTIQPAPHWRLLKTYGGKMTIEEFRDAFLKKVYKDGMIIKGVAKTKPIGMVFEEFLKL